jgi:serine/threonine-protein kinase RsbW
MRWRRVFPGEERQLSTLRRWLAALLPESRARGDVLIVVTELGSNAIRHTASGRGGWFAVEVTWHQSTVRVAVADGGGSAEPRVISDVAGDSGRGLLLVRGLSVRMGNHGDRRGRLVWADVRWDDSSSTAPGALPDAHEAAIRDGQAALARRFGGIPAWFGRSTLAWWAMPSSGALVSARSARELAALLYRWLEASQQQPPRPPASYPKKTGRCLQQGAGGHREVRES